MSATPPQGTGSTEPSSVGSVPTEMVGQPLGLGDAHSASDGWEEKLYELADGSEARAMGVPVPGCGESYSLALEYRLANRFKTLSMDVSQANSSKDSNQTLIVVVEGNENQLEFRPAPFNEALPIKDLPIDGVNALRIKLFLDDTDEDCTYSSNATAVIERLVVS